MTPPPPLLVLAACAVLGSGTALVAVPGWAQTAPAASDRRVATDSRAPTGGHTILEAAGATAERGAAVAPVTSSSSGAADGRWVFPLTPRPSVVTPFSAPAGPYAAGHRGVDLTARVDEVVRSPAAGTVAFSGTVAGRHVVVVDHAGGLRSTLEPVTGSRPVGSAVDRGEEVGTVDDGPGHCRPATCVHWGVIRGATYLDPLRFVTVPHVELLPLEP